MFTFERVYTEHDIYIEQRLESIVISYARTSKEVNSSMSKAQISGYCKRLWEVHHSLRTKNNTLHLLCTKLGSSHHSQEHTLHPQIEDSCSNPVALPHRVMSCQLQQRIECAEGFLTHADSIGTDC